MFIYLGKKEIDYKTIEKKMEDLLQKFILKNKHFK